MSLLLDALKKAADDKQKASQGSSDDTAKESSVTAANFRRETTRDNSTQVNVNPANSASADKPKTDTKTQAIDSVSSDSEELTLDIIEDDEPLLEVMTEVTNKATNDMAAADINGSALESKEDSDTINNIEAKAAVSSSSSASSNQTPSNQVSSGSSNTVSDEALSLLINKTNREVKNTKRNIIIMLTLLGIAILSTGGIYYYFDMQAEMTSLQSKHNIAMMAMRSKVGGNEITEESKIIRSFVNKAEPEENIKLAKEKIAEDKKSKRAVTRPPKKRAQPALKTARQKNNSATAQSVAGVYSIQKTNKSDPLGEKLDDAWLAYEDGRYDNAEKLYAEVLKSEKNNRDAMLGMAAIAIQHNEPAQAKKYYQALLSLDPRDPVAIAGISSLNADGEAAQASESYLLNMLEKNPKAAQLNFALANIYAQKGEWKAAQKYYFNAWQQDSENADYLFNMAVSLDQLEKQQQALKFYNESLLRAEGKQVGFSREAVQQRIKVLSEK